MSNPRLILGTRATPLAVAQSEIVATQLRAQGLRVEIKKLSSAGDRSLGGSLVQSKGMFTAELDRALVQREVDLVVHSLKDLPVDGDPELVIAAIPQRAAPNDLLILRPGVEVEAPPGATPDRSAFGNLAELLPASGARGASSTERPPSVSAASSAQAAFCALPRGALLGTSSPRRQAGALELRPDLVCVAIRGSVGRRLEWLRADACDALILAEAGLARLPPAPQDSSGDPFRGLRAARLDLETWPCAPGQGALAVQVLRAGPWHGHPAIQALDHLPTRRAVEIERDLLRRLGGGCQAPFAACCREGLLDAAVAAASWSQRAAFGRAPRLFRLLDRDRDLEPTGTAAEAAKTLTAQIESTAAKSRLAQAAIPSIPSVPDKLSIPDLAVTSSETGCARLTRLLPSEARVAALPCTEAVTLQVDWPSPESELEGPRRSWPWVLVSSPQAARQLVERSRQDPVWSRLPWCALGEGTARELLGLGAPPNLVARARHADDFADFILAAIAGASAFYLPHSARSSGQLPQRLRDAGRTVHAWAAYTVAPRSELCWPDSWAGSPERILFTAPSHVEAFLASELGLPTECWALGEPTATAFREATAQQGREPSGNAPSIEVAASPDAEGILELWQRLTHKTEPATT